MKVSIVMITYNHEPYIRQAVESVLMQETDFDYELVVGDDASTDNTRRILLELQQQHPHKMRLLLHEKNLGGRIPGKLNFLQTLQTAQGQYIALLDGDDYWTSPHKLQKQVGFLDQHPDFAACFHNVTFIYEDGSREPHNHCPPDQKEVITFHDLLTHNYIASSSVLFRKGLFGTIPPAFYKVPIGDWALHIMNAQYGKIEYLNESMSVYRVHAKAAWSNLNSIDKLVSLSQTYHYLQGCLEPENKPLLKTPMCKCDWGLANRYRDINNRFKARAYMRKCLTHYGFSKDVPFRDYCGLFLWLNMPALYNFLRSLKRLGSAPN